MFAIRFGVQHWLYDQASSDWTAVAKVALNYPLWALALSVSVWAVRRSDRRLAEPADPSTSDESADAGIGHRSAMRHSNARKTRSGSS